MRRGGARAKSRNAVPGQFDRYRQAREVERALGACAAEGSAAATREKTVRFGITACAQGTTLGLSPLPNRPRFSHVSHQSLLPRRLLDPFRHGCTYSALSEWMPSFDLPQRSAIRPGTRVLADPLAWQAVQE
jgi:hypothetical protein